MIYNHQQISRYNSQLINQPGYNFHAKNTANRPLSAIGEDLMKTSFIWPRDKLGEPRGSCVIWIGRCVQNWGIHGNTTSK